MKKKVLWNRPRMYCCCVWCANVSKCAPVSQCTSFRKGGRGERERGVSKEQQMCFYYYCPRSKSILATKLLDREEEFYLKPFPILNFSSDFCVQIGSISLAFLCPENTYLLHMGKFHCMADLLLDWFGFD